MTDENGLARTEEHGAEAVRAIATPEELAAFEVRFLRLLERHTAIYTMGDSTSVPRHVAADLLQSIAFVLGIDPARPEVPRELLAVDLEEEYRRRLEAVGRKVQEAEKAWRAACDMMPLIENIALRDTLSNIGDFFKWYDYRSMAHEIPCSIDYPLCHPVPESLPGIDYIHEYVRRLEVEADFLRRLDLAAVERVLRASSPDYLGLLVNLYEPVAVNALGLVLLGKDPGRLWIAEKDRATIARQLEPLGETARAKALREAARCACDALGIEDARAREYLGDLVPELLPRIEVGLANGDLRGVFVGEVERRVHSRPGS